MINVSTCKYGNLNKYISVIKILYESTYGKSIVYRAVIPCYRTKGVRQGCVLLPLLFLLVTDWVMNYTVDGNASIGRENFERVKDLKCVSFLFRVVTF